MILTLPLWLLRGVSVVLLVGCVVLVIALLALGRLREARTLRDLAGLQEAFAALRVGAVNPLCGRTSRFHELLVLRMSRNVSGPDAETLVRWCTEAGVVDRAVAWTTSRRWVTRARGVRLLACLDVEPDVLLGMLADPRPEVRQQAAEHAPRSTGKARVAALVRLFDDPDPGVRFAAMDSVARCGEAAVSDLSVSLFVANRTETLLAALQVSLTVPSARLAYEADQLCRSTVPEVRGGALQLIATISTAAGATPQRLLAGLDDPAAANRAIAAEGLGRLRHLGAAPKLAQMMQDSSWDVRRASGVALYAMGASGQVVLRQMTRSPDRYAADMAKLVLSASRMGRM